MRRIFLCCCILSAPFSGGACNLSTEGGDQFQFPSRGVVTGTVQDTAGRGVAGVGVSTLATYDAFGTLVLVASSGFTTGTGTYLVELGVGYETEVRAALTVSAAPPSSSGLQARDTSGLQVLITKTLPPAETTKVNFVLRNP
jgi:hypothetical protein